MNTSDGLPPLRDVVRAHGLAARKSLGQNFLFDLNLTGRIARAAGPLENIDVIEIGPGPGGLTRALLANGARKIVAIERDERCVAALAEIAEYYPGRLNVIQDDALKITIEDCVKTFDLDGPVRIAANLPYNIATALLTRWLEIPAWPPVWDRLTLMFQKEVAQRIVATPAQRADYGRLAILAGWRTSARILFDVAPAAFTPQPKVISSIVELVPNSNAPVCDVQILAAITRAAFGQRRKMLRQSLKALRIGNVSIAADKILERTAIDPRARAEEIDIDGYIRLAQYAQSLIDSED